MACRAVAAVSLGAAKPDGPLAYDRSGPCTSQSILILPGEGQGGQFVHFGSDATTESSDCMMPSVAPPRRLAFPKKPNPLRFPNDQSESLQPNLGPPHCCDSALRADATVHWPAPDPRSDQSTGVSDAPRPRPESPVPQPNSGYCRSHHSH